MKKGSKSIRCNKCGKIVGWTIPLGVTDHGIERVSIKLNKVGCSLEKGFCLRYFCKECAKEGK